MPTNHITQAQDILKERKLKATHERTLVLSLLIQRHTPLTAEDIYACLSKEMHESTVYRILEKFIEKDILYQTDFRDNKTYYEYQTSHHHHITCTHCGTQEHTAICLPSSVEEKLLITSKLFCSPIEHNLEFFGTCKKCQS